MELLLTFTTRYFASRWCNYICTLMTNISTAKTEPHDHIACRLGCHIHSVQLHSHQNKVLYFCDHLFHIVQAPQCKYKSSENTYPPQCNQYVNNTLMRITVTIQTATNLATINCLLLTAILYASAASQFHNFCPKIWLHLLIIQQEDLWLDLSHTRDHQIEVQPQVAPALLVQ